MKIPSDLTELQERKLIKAIAAAGDAGKKAGVSLRELHARLTVLAKLKTKLEGS